VPARTPGEKRAETDGKLDASLGKFDEQLRREQQRSAEERDNRTAAGGAGGSGDEGRSGSTADVGGRDRSGDLRSEGSNGNARNGGAAGGSAEAAGGAAGDTSGNSVIGGGGGAAAKPIPSGDDDDIIARRLRKAAEAETDPELKEKLWNEYRDYKANTGGRK
jgi:hypothetical protein